MMNGTPTATPSAPTAADPYTTPGGQSNTTAPPGSALGDLPLNKAQLTLSSGKPKKVKHIKDAALEQHIRETAHE